jgi:GntR family transcriptional regulator
LHPSAALVLLHPYKQTMRGLMHLHLSASDGPLYQQIVHQIKTLVASGRLAPGEELPPIRTLAEQLMVNANTVARAYRELGEEGVLTNRRTAGTYVAAGAAERAREDRLGALAGRVDALLAEARLLNVDLDDLVNLIRRRGGASRHAREK